jgi:hypothetical protein
MLMSLEATNGIIVGYLSITLESRSVQRFVDSFRDIREALTVLAISLQKIISASNRAIREKRAHEVKRSREGFLHVLAKVKLKYSPVKH